MAPEGGTPAPPAVRRRLLLVDDSLLVQRMIRDYFESAGYTLEAAANGREGLEAARRQRPDVIIADIIMPVMDGWEFCEAIRKDPSTADIPLLFLTAVREAPQRVQGLRLGADDYITKPFSREELLARVELCLAKAERLRAAGAADAALSGHTSHVAISDLLQVLSQNGKTGTLRLRDPAGREGRVLFRAGKVVNARVGAVEGKKALYRLLDWAEARFEMDVSDEVASGEAIRETTSNVLMDGFTQNDELRALRAQLPPPWSRFAISPELARSAERPGLGVTEQAVLVAFRDAAAFGDVLDHSPLNDLEVSRAVLRLLQLKLLVPVDTAAGTAG